MDSHPCNYMLYFCPICIIWENKVNVQLCKSCPLYHVQNISMFTLFKCCSWKRLPLYIRYINRLSTFWSSKWQSAHWRDLYTSDSEVCFWIELLHKYSSAHSACLQQPTWKQTFHIHFTKVSVTSVRHVLRLVTYVYQTVISVMLIWQTSSLAPEHTFIAICYRIKVCLKVDGRSAL